MLLRVTITCFAASYVVALILELTRLRFRSGIRGATLLVFAGAGLFAHTVYLCNRAAVAARTPLSSEHDWYLVAAWVCVVAYILLTCHFKRAALGLFFLPLVLVLIAVATFPADREPFAREPASLFWGIFHGTSILLAAVTVFAGFLAATMYLGLARRLKRKLPPPRGLRLPSLEQLERTSRRAVVVAAVFMFSGVMSGILLKLISAESSIPWYDPLILCTCLTSAWLTTAAVIFVSYRPARRGPAPAYITITTFAFLVISLGVGLLVDSQHGGTAQSNSDVRSATPYDTKPMSVREVNDRAWRSLFDVAYVLAPRSGGTPKPRVAQRTLGAEGTVIPKTPTGFYTATDVHLGRSTCVGTIIRGMPHGLADISESHPFRVPGRGSNSNPGVRCATPGYGILRLRRTNPGDSAASKLALRASVIAPPGNPSLPPSDPGEVREVRPTPHIAWRSGGAT